MKRIVEANMPTKWGEFNMLAYSFESNDRMPHIALVHKDLDPTAPVYVRIHSECMTGDLFGSKRCDCGEQLEESLRIVQQKKGLVIYLRQEGRGIGILEKLKAYNLQDEGLNTADANVHLGHKIDDRRYDLAITILKDLDIQSIYLLTNNPEKIEAIEKSAIDLKGRIPLVIAPSEENEAYLKTKKDLMGHLLNGQKK